MNNTEKLYAIKSATQAQKLMALLSLAPMAGAGVGTVSGYRGSDDSAGKVEGTFRGGTIGTGAGLGALLGGGAGYKFSDGNALATLLGAGLGGLGGGKLTQGILGRPGLQLDEDRGPYR